MTPRDTLTVLNSGIAALASICEGFFEGTAASLDAHSISPGDVPEPFRKLLVHQEHMTVVLQQHYGRPVELRVLNHFDGDGRYIRRILLVLAETGEVIEYGIVRLNWDLVPAGVRKEVSARQAPLGEILIRHDVLRRIDPKWFFRFGPGSPFVQHFERHGVDAYGRVGIIHCDDRPAIQLLEVVTDAKG